MSTPDRRSEGAIFILAAAQAEADVAAVWEEGMRRRHSGQLALMQRLEAAKALAAGLTAQRAADICAALSTKDICDVLIEQRGWNLDEYENWLATTLSTLLLAPPKRRKDGTPRAR
jgi:hypothetical protein